MKYIMGKGNMSVVVDNQKEVAKLKLDGFKLQGTALTYEQARTKVAEAVKRAGYKVLEELPRETDVSIIHNLNWKRKGDDPHAKI